VRTSLRLSILSAAAALALAACSKTAPTGRALSDDLKRDLQLASSTGLDLASKQAAASFPLTEVAPVAAPAPTRTLKKATGPKAVPSKKPTVNASPDASIAEAESPQVEVMSQAPAPTTEQLPEPAAPAVPRPSPVPVMAGGGSGRSDGGMGGGSILGGIFGAIIRGGGVDGDHCEIHDGRRGRRSGGGYIPQQVPMGRLPSGISGPYGGLSPRGR
jgi:hypothetical protein